MDQRRLDMKYIIILGDGMADEPIPSLGGKTPLQAAAKPEMDWLAAHGRNGLLDTIPRGFAPGSEIADGRIKNHSGGQISSEEAAQLMEYLQQELGGGDVNFFPGVSYRHLLKMKGGNKHIITTPPHDVIGAEFGNYLVKPDMEGSEETAEKLNRLILKSMELLPGHPVNIARAKAGKDMANSIWPWSPGYRPKMETMQQQFPEIRSGSVISAVDLIKGIGVYAGLDPVYVKGATGLYDTNYEGKAEAAIKATFKMLNIIEENN